MKKIQPHTYTLMGELMASPTNPLDDYFRTEQVRRMRAGFDAMTSGATPRPNDWRLVSDAVNLMETLVRTNNGWWPDCDGEVIRVVDGTGLLTDAIEALGESGQKHMEGKPLRLSGLGLQAVRAVLDDYEEVLGVLPARTMFKCHRLTEKRVRDLLSGKSQSHDVVVVSL